MIEARSFIKEKLTKYLSILIVCFTAFIIASFTYSFNTEIEDGHVTNSENLSTLDFNDGPYILINRDSLVELNIINGKLDSKTYGLQMKKVNFENEVSVYTTDEKIAALSDLHGQYELTLKILKNNKIIDENLNWSFGKGHLVIVGDIFDRGPKVTELLWFVYELEKQAFKSGGKVHFTLGNHEYMVMQNDLRYVNRKYRITQQILKIPYDQLYGNQTLLGRWLRSKATILRINDYLFVHGGISKEFIDTGFNIEESNRIMRQSLYDDISTVKSDSIYDKYNTSKGPLWYRGYFTDSLKNREIKQLLKKIDVKQIVVGHTSQTKIESLFSNKIFAVDTSVKLGKSGEILLIENGSFYRGTIDGEKIKLRK